MVKPLQFNESLNWPAGKPIQVKELLSRLKALATELGSLDAEDTEKTSLRPSAAQLASGQLLNHKDAGVKAWTAVCIVEALRVCAPNAPFSSTQLNDIFTFLVNSIIPNIADPVHAFSAQYRHVLKSLSDTQSIILMTDVRNATNLIRKFFLTSFDILSNTAQDIGRGNELHIGDLMQCLVNEYQNLPGDAVQTVMAQFLRADPRTAAFFAGRQGAVEGSDDKPPASYTIAAMLCTACADRMSLHVAQYFSSIIIDAASLDTSKSKHKRHSDVDITDLEVGPSEEDLKELDKAHRLLRELWRASPRVLQNVIPQIESELLTENIHLRTLATETLGDMAAGIGAAPLALPPSPDPATYPQREMRVDEGPARAPEKFMRVYASVYQKFMSRQNDKHSPIRAAWTSAVGRILFTNAGGIGLTTQEEKELVESLARMLVDNDEKVRIAAIQSVGLFDLDTIVSRIGPYGDMNKDGSLLKNLADRVREKKHTVRIEAATLLGKIWAMAAGPIAAGQVEVKELLGEIPSKILDAYYINDKDIFALIDQVLFEYFMPVAFPATKKRGQVDAVEAGTPSSGNMKNEDADKIRVERLLLLFSGLSQRAKPVLMKLMGRPLALQNYVSILLKRCEDYNGGIMEKNRTEIEQHLGRLISYFAKETPDPVRASDDLWKFAKLHDGRAYKLIRFCIASESDYRKIVNSIKELKKRLENANFATTSTETVINFVRRVANLYFNKSHIQPIVSISQTDAHGSAGAANDLLMELTSKNPAAFKSHSEELFQSLVNQAPSATQDNGPTVLDALKACAPFAKKYPADIPKDRKFLAAMMQYALRGTPPTAAKYAVSILMSSGQKKEMYAKDLLEKCTEGYEHGTGDFLSKLACLSQLMLTSAQVLEEDLDPVIDIAINQTLLKVRTDTDSEQQWASTMDEECEAKVWAVKILVNRVRPYTNAEEAREIAKPVYQLLTTLISKKGELSKRTPTPETHKSRLRLQAALSLLKLSTNRSFDQFLTPAHFVQLATVAQDELHPIRDIFVRKLKKYLGQDRLSSRFYIITFLLAFEPSTRLREETMTWLRARAKAFSQTNRLVLELLFARFISLLAHHPDFGLSTEDLSDFVRYFLFYLRATANEENLGVIYHVAQRVKGVQDGIKSEASENLYVLSDLAQAVIQSYEEAKGWSMQAFSGKVQLPTGIFANLPNHDVAQDIASKTFLQQDMAVAVDDLVRADLKAKNSRKRKSEGHASAVIAERPVKQRKSESSMRQSAASRRTRTPTQKRNRHADSSDDEDEAGSLMGSGAPTDGVTRRRSGRASGSNAKNYAESSEDEEAEPLADDHDDEAEADAEDEGQENAKANGKANGGHEGNENDDNEAGKSDIQLGSDNEVPHDERSKKQTIASNDAVATTKTKKGQTRLPFKTTAGSSPMSRKQNKNAVPAKAAVKKASPRSVAGDKAVPIESASSSRPRRTTRHG